MVVAWSRVSAAKVVKREWSWDPCFTGRGNVTYDDLIMGGVTKKGETENDSWIFGLS